MKIFDIFLKRSNRYNFYKSNYEALEKKNKKQEKRIKSLKRDLKSKNKDYYILLDKFNQFNNDLNYLKKKCGQDLDLTIKNHLINQEIHYALIFNDTIKDSEWLKSRNFSLNNGAANYSFMYVLFRILDETSPKNILELGLGQTTKLTTQYVNFFNKTKLLTIDGDQDWIDNFSNKLTIEGNIKIEHCDLETFDYENTKNLRYKNIKNTVGDEKFDLVVIDGPQGFFS